jgi:hypothetical protein
MSSIAIGQANTTSKINWFIMQNLVLADAYEVGFRIFDITEGLPGSQIFPSSGWEDVSALPGKFATGSYYAYDNDAGTPWTPPVGTNTGTHRIFWRWKYLATDAYDQSAEDFEVTEEVVTLEADFLTLNDLYKLVGSEKVIQLFDDSISGTFGSTNESLQEVLQAAEGEAYARLKRSWSTASIQAIAGVDRAFRRHCAWVALEFASERRPAFCSEEGKGQYWAQYERAIDHFEALSKTRLRSKGETVAGAGANLGGNMRPTSTAKKVDSLIFTPTEKNPYGSGGYVLPLMFIIESLLRHFGG